MALPSQKTLQSQEQAPYYKKKGGYRYRKYEEHDYYHQPYNNYKSSTAENSKSVNSSGWNHYSHNQYKKSNYSGYNKINDNQDNYYEYSNSKWDKHSNRRESFDYSSKNKFVRQNSNASNASKNSSYNKANAQTLSYDGHQMSQEEGTSDSKFESEHNTTGSFTNDGNSLSHTIESDCSEASQEYSQ
jgi:hypothetical protein